MSLSQKRSPNFTAKKPHKKTASKNTQIHDTDEVSEKPIMTHIAMNTPSAAPQPNRVFSSSGLIGDSSGSFIF
jgi:hypothetical protein